MSKNNVITIPIAFRKYHVGDFGFDMNMGVSYIYSI